MTKTFDQTRLFVWKKTWTISFMVKSVVVDEAIVSCDTVVGNDFQLFTSSINTLAKRSSSCDVLVISPKGPDGIVTRNWQDEAFGKRTYIEEKKF